MILTQRLWLRETCHSRNSGGNHHRNHHSQRSRKYQTSNVCHVKMDPETPPFSPRWPWQFQRLWRSQGLLPSSGRRFDGRLFGSLLWNSCFKRDGRSNNLTHPCVLRATPRVKRREYAMFSVTWQTWRISQSICPPRNGFESIQTWQARKPETHSQS